MFLVADNDVASTYNALLTNPFNWVLNQGLGSLSVPFSQSQLIKFVTDIFSLRNSLGAQPVDETLEVPCAIIGA